MVLRVVKLSVKKAAKRIGYRTGRLYVIQLDGTIQFIN